MAKVLRCPACGEIRLVPTCASCGAGPLAEGLEQSPDQLATDLAQSLSDRDQIGSDRDQTATDEDQTWSDRDQTASESDQRSADEDQRAADSDFAAGGNLLIYRLSARAREQSSRDRTVISDLRDASAAARLRTADDRDRAAALRDRGATGRDALARLHDLEDDTYASKEEIRARAARDRARAAADRAKAADDRMRAATDREAAARERADARRERTQSAVALKLAATDELTGAWTRKFGLEEVSRELERTRRTRATLLLAFIDVDGLKHVNDSRGHLAGDALLQLLGKTLRANVRPYDVIVRYGGDEFVCAMPDLSGPEARVRLETIAAALKAVDAEHSVTFGLAEAEPADSLKDLIARADADLLAARRAGNGE